MPYDPTRQSKIKKSGTGRLAVIPKINAYQAKQEALHMIRRGRMKPTSKLYNVVGLLGTAGVLPEADVIELGLVTKRTLNRYRKDAILDVIPTPPLIGQELDPKQLWALGPVGLQLAKIQFELVPTGYLESKIDNVSHDVLCNCLYTQLHKATKNTEYTAILWNRYEVSLVDYKGVPYLQPDGMITLKGNGKVGHFLLEYHNEDWGGRASEKIKKYENLRGNNYTKVEWRDQWQLEKFPPILVIARHKAVATGYKEAVEQRAIIHNEYLINYLSNILGKIGERDGLGHPMTWHDLRENKRVLLEDYMY